MIRYKLIPSLMLGLFILFAGCAPEISSPGASKPKSVDFVAPGSPGKPSAPIMISHTFDGVRSIGQSIRINLSVVSKTPASKVTIKVSSTGGLQIVTPDREKSYDNVAANTAISHSIDMIPQANGLFYLNVFVEIVSDGVKATKVMVIPIEVGTKGRKPVMKTNGSIKSDESGKKTITLPADVTIIRK